MVVHWIEDRDHRQPDRSFLFTITGTAAQAVERARLTLTEFVNLERSQHLHQLSSALAAATTPGDVAQAAIAGGRRALGRPIRRRPRPLDGRACPDLPGQQRAPGPPVPATVPLDGSRAGAAFVPAAPPW